MTLKGSLFGGAAVAVVLCLGASETAEARTSRHRAPAGADQAALKAQVEALRAQVQALESRLDAQAQTQQQTQAQAQNAQSQAQAAQTTAQAAQTQAAAAQSQIQTIPTEVATAVKKATPKPGWEANTTVGATMFADFSHIDNSIDGVRNAQSGTDYDIKRFYIIIDHKFNDVFSANLTTDFQINNGLTSIKVNPANPGGPFLVSSQNNTQLIIKKAWLQAKLSDAFIIRAGASDLPWVPFIEKLYGYRYVENTFIDRTKFGTSTDWGLHVFGTFADNIISYQVSVVDGSGFKSPAVGTANRTETVDVEGRLSATYKHFTAGVGGYDGRLGKDVVGTPVYHAAQRLDAVLAYTDDRIRIGGEYFWAKHWSDVLQPVDSKTNTSDGYSIFGSYNFTKQIAVFGRYDWVKPQKDTAPSFVDHYFNVGVSYSPIKPLDLALVYKREAVDDGLFSSSNGVVGGLVHGTYDEIGLFSQVKF